MRFYLDEDLSDKIAAIARERGVDIVSSHESGLNGQSDERQLLLAAQDGRCVITRNHRHFALLSKHFEERGLPHAGVLVVPRSMPGEYFSAIANAIVRFDAEHPEGIPPYAVFWLSARIGNGS